MPKRSKARRRWTHWSADHAGRVLHAWRRSGLSAAEFGRREGVAPQRLLRWQRRLEAGSERTESPALQRVQVVEEPVAASGGLEIELGQGVRVRVRADVDEATLRRVLRVLREAA